MVKALIKSGFDGSVHNPHSKTDEALQDLICFGSTEVKFTFYFMTSYKGIA